MDSYTELANIVRDVRPKAKILRAAITKDGNTAAVLVRDSDRYIAWTVNIKRSSVFWGHYCIDFEDALKRYRVKEDYLTMEENVR